MFLLSFGLLLSQVYEKRGWVKVVDFDVFLKPLSECCHPLGISITDAKKRSADVGSVEIQSQRCTVQCRRLVHAVQSKVPRSRHHRMLALSLAPVTAVRGKLNAVSVSVPHGANWEPHTLFRRCSLTASLGRWISNRPTSASQQTFVEQKNHALSKLCKAQQVIETVSRLNAKDGSYEMPTPLLCYDIRSKHKI